MILAGIFGGFGLVEVLIIGMIGLLVFGKRLPEVGRNLGRSISEFKRGISDSAVAARPPVPNELPAALAGPEPQALPSGPADQELVEARIAKLATELKSLQREAAAKASSKGS